MAVVHQKKAGQWGKKRANHLRDRTMGLLFFFAVFMGFAAGYVLGTVYWRHAVWILVPPLALFWFAAWKPLERQMDKWTKERIRYMRGAQAEALVAWYLQDLPETWHVFNNLPCAKGGDVDHIVIGPGGLFVVSTKSYKGHVTRTASGAIRLNGNPLDKEMDEAMSLALWVRDRLKATLGNQVPWVQPVLALPMAQVSIPPTETPVWVFDETAVQDGFTPDKPKWRITSGRTGQVVAELERVVVA